MHSNSLRIFMMLVGILVMVYPPQVYASLPSDPDDFVAELETIINEEMAHFNVPNAVVTIVQNGDIYTMQGYGETAVGSGIPVDPQTAIFRVASVSKSITATAIMTLVDQGMISLTDDVNQYLDEFQLESIDGTIVTFEHLLTHTGGLDDKVYFPTAVESATDYISLPDTFISSPPVRYDPSGIQTRYSNQGYVLLGYLIEQISGMSFEAYVQQNVFIPLGMSSSTFEQQLPQNLQQNLVARYDFDDDTFIEEPFIYVNEMPAGGMFTTASDMANFMIMNLNNGVLDDEQILRADLVTAMHDQQFTNHESLGGYGYGFWRSEHNGLTMIMHDGSGPAVSSRMVLLPDENVGVFFAHHGGGAGFRAQVMARLLDEYFGLPQQPVENLSGTAEQVAGLYKNNRYVHDGYFRIPTMITLEYNIRTDNGRLYLEDGLLAGESEYVEVSTGVFQQIDLPSNQLVFHFDDNGRVSQLNANLYHTPLDFEPVAWYESNPFLLASLIVPFLICLVATITMPVASVIRAFRHVEYSQLEILAHWLGWSFAVSGLFIMGLFVIGDLSPLPYASPHTSPMTVYGILTIANLVVILALVIIVFWCLAISGQYWGLTGRIGYTILTIGSIAYLWFSIQNSLIGYNL